MSVDVFELTEALVCVTSGCGQMILNGGVHPSTREVGMPAMLAVIKLESSKSVAPEAGAGAEVKHTPRHPWSEVSGWCVWASTSSVYSCVTVCCHRVLSPTTLGCGQTDDGDDAVT